MSTTLTAQSGNAAEVVLLNISGLRLMLPQGEMRALEASSAIDTDETKPFSVGWVRLNEARWPVYCLSPELSLLVVVPKERRSCLVLGSSAGYVGILCDEFNVGVRLPPEQQHELPPAMRTADTPILGLATLEDEAIACITSAERLIEHITRQVNL